MAKKLLLWFIGLLVVGSLFSAFTGSAQAAQSIVVHFGSQEEIVNNFTVGVGKTRRTNFIIRLSEKPTSNVVITAELQGALPSTLVVGSSTLESPVTTTKITLTPTNWNKYEVIDFVSKGGGTAGQRARIILKDSGSLRAEISVSGIAGDADFAAVSVGSPPNSNGSTTTPTETGKPSEEELPDVVLEGCGSGTNVLGEPPPCNLSDYIANQEGFVYKSWVIVRSAVNILLVIALLAISFSNITRISIDTYVIKKALPNLLIGIVLANASMYMIRFLADIATVVVYFFVNMTGAETFSQFLTTAMVAVTVTGLETIGGIAGTPIVQAIVTFLAGIVFIVLLLWLAFLLYIRLVVVYLLTIVSPVAFIAYGLPGMDRFFKQWWQQFTKWLFMIIPMSAVFWLMWVVYQGSGLASIASFLIQIFLFITAVTMPTKMGGAVLDKASKAFMKYTGTNAAKNYAAEKGKDTARWVGSRTPGLYRAQEYFKQRKENFETDLETRRTRAGAWVATTGAGTDKVELAKLKSTAEALKKKNESRTDLEYMSSAETNNRVKNILDELAKETSESSALSEAVTKMMDIEIVGSHTSKRHDVLSKVLSHNDAQKKINQLREQEAKDREDYKNGKISRDDYVTKRTERTGEYKKLKDSQQDAAAAFDKLKVDHLDLEGAKIEELSSEISAKSIRGRIIEAEGKRQGTFYSDGVAGQSKEIIENGSVEELVSEFGKFFNPDSDFAKTLEKLASGRQVGLTQDDKTRDFGVVVEALKGFMKSNNNANFAPAIGRSLELLVKQGKEEIKVLTKYDEHGNDIGHVREVVITAANIDNFAKNIGKMDRKDQMAFSKSITQHQTFSGTAAKRSMGS